MHSDKHFMGLNGFVWFYGVVEDRMDPLKIKRVRVRALTHHTSDKVKLPTTDLPWSEVLNSVWDDLTEGSWVLGYFKDGIQKQQPVVLGTWDGIPSAPANPNSGFYDPRTDFSSAPTLVTGINDPGTGEGISTTTTQPGAHPRNIGEPETSRYMRNEEYPGLKNRLRVTNVPSASHATTGADGDSNVEGETFSEPEDAYAAKYPYNHVKETESGHVIELDDTPGAERISTLHRSGSYYELRPDGTLVLKGNKDLALFSRRNLLVNSNGKAQVTIDKGMQLLVNSAGGSESLTVQIGSGGNLNITVVKGSVNLNILEGNLNKKVNGDYNEHITGNVNRFVKGTVNETVEGDVERKINGGLCENVDGNRCETTNGTKTETTAQTATYAASGAMTISGSPLIWNP